MSDAHEQLPTDPRRVRAFASFFKNYMSVSSLVVAALPVPVTALGAIPTFASERTALSTYTSLFCFLILGFIFYIRHSLAIWMFPEFSRADPTTLSRKASAAVVRVLPLVLIVGAAALVYEFHTLMARAVFEIAQSQAFYNGPANVSCLELNPVELARICTVPSPEEVLAAQYFAIPSDGLIRGSYLGMFVCAEAAFILMAIREYLQDLLRLSDLEIIAGARHSAA